MFLLKPSTMKFRSSYVISIIMFVVSTTIQAQSWQKSIRDDQRKQRLNQIKPPIENQMSDKMKHEDVNILETKDETNILARKNRIKQTGGAEFDDKYDVKKLVKTINNENLLKVEKGTHTKVILFNGKARLVKVQDTEYHLNRISQYDKLGGLKVSSGFGGLNLSGYKKKEMSKKSRSLLNHVLTD